MELAFFYRQAKDFTPAGVKPFSRVYLGAEFCEALLPGAKTLARLMEKARSLKLKISLVFPSLSIKGLQQAVKLLESLDLQDDELVIQDWGLLYWFLKHRPPATPVLGRVLVRQKTGPQIMRLKEKFPQVVESSQKIPGFSRPFFNWLLELGIRRAEIENPLQGFLIPDSPRDFAFSLHYPTVLVSLTRKCPAKIASNLQEAVGLGKCGKICQKITGELWNENIGFPLISRGNSLLYNNPDLPPKSELIKLGVNRLVYENLCALS